MKTTTSITENTQCAILETTLRENTRFVRIFLEMLVFSQSIGSKPYSFSQDCVDSHNKLRALHGSPPLAWSQELTDHAQKWVDSLAKRDAFEHDNAGLAKYEEGENIAWFMGKGKVCTTKLMDDCYPCSTAVQPWYDEIKDYDFQKGAAKSPGLPVLHFTQV